MSFLDRVRACNNADLSRFVPFSIGGIRVGYLYPDFAGRLADFPGVFAVTGQGVALADALDTPERRTAAVGGVLRDLAAAGVFKGWRGENYPVQPIDGGATLMAMERAAVPHFGIRAYGVHMTGYVRGADGLHVWVARRSYDKPTYPGMLDNMVAGGQPVGIPIRDNMIKECREEAAIPAAIAERVRPVGAITYAYEGEGGLKPDVQYCFDLELPADFIPRNADGEVHEFMLWPVDRLAQVVRDTAEFKFNCNLVIIDFLIRHGLIAPDHPDYVALCRGLRAQ